MASEKPLYSLHRLHGLLLPQFVKEENLSKLKDLQLYPDDVWVVTYPKCGTTWTQQIVRLIRNNGVQDGVKITAAVPWLEMLKDPLVVAQHLRRPRAFKSHLPYHLLPCGPPHTTPCKYIYVTRNPKDAAVSFYFHERMSVFPGIEWDAYFKKYIAGEVEYGNYFDHVLSWLPHRDDKNVLFLSYEDMKRDLPAAVSQIASFMEADISGDVVAKIADLTTFDKMQNDHTANYLWFPHFHKRGATKFLRKGTVGDWKNFFTADQSAELDEIIAQRLEATCSEFHSKL